VTKTIVETRINRKFTAFKWNGGVDLDVRDTSNNDRVFSVLSPEQANDLATALLPEGATVITDLPEATRGTNGYIAAGGYSRYQSNTPEEVLNNAKALLAIHKVMVEQQAVAAKEAEAAKAKEAARTKRRDALVQELTGNPHTAYVWCGDLSKVAVDRIIELEEAAK